MSTPKAAWSGWALGLEVKPGDTVRCTVEAVDDEGRGRAVVGDLDVAVRGALPGDVVHARIERIWPSHGIAQARALKLERESDLHVDRNCPHTAPCAGCPMQGVEPTFARAWKKARVERALASAGLSASVADVEPSRAPRQKAKLVVDTGRLGLYVPHTHIPVDATGCPYHHPVINRALARLAPVLKRIVSAKAVIVRAYREGAGVVVVADMPLHSGEWSSLSDLVDDKPIASLSLRLHVDGSANSVVAGEISQSIGPRALTPLEGGPPVEVDAFCQPDPALAAHIYQRVAAFLVEEKGEKGRILDLYAGTGGFSAAMLERGAKDIVAVERARATWAVLSTLPIDARHASVEDALPTLASSAIAGIVVDPPKAGLGVLAQKVASLRAQRVAIVACDPDAGARDARFFVDDGYRLTAVEPFDLFPGSIDVETLFFLRRC